MVVEGEANYATSLEKNLTLAKEVERARSKFDSLQQQQNTLETHHNAIKHGKGGFSIDPKPLFFFGGGLNSNDPDSTWGMEFLIVTSCAFCGRKFSFVWDCQLMYYLHMYHSWCDVTLFCFHQVFGEGLKLGYSLKLVGKLWDFKTLGEVG